MHKINTTGHQKSIPAYFKRYCKSMACCTSTEFLLGDAEKVSIDAFNKLQYGNGVVVGITFVKVFMLTRHFQNF